MKKEEVVTPIVLNTIVQEIIANSNDLIIERVLDRMAIKAQQLNFREIYGVNEDWHRRHKISGMQDRGCGCSYCQAVHKYVIIKVAAHRLRRRLDSYYYMFHPYNGNDDFKMLKILDDEWQQLRKYSHEIRDLLGIKQIKGVSLLPL